MGQKLLQELETGNIETDKVVVFDRSGVAKAIPARDLDREAREIATAWVNFDGTTTPPRIRSSFNVSSVVKNSMGRYVVNFSEAMDTANFCVVGAAGADSGGTWSSTLSIDGKTTHSVGITAGATNMSSGVHDWNNLNILVFGGK